MTHGHTEPAPPNPKLPKIDFVYSDPHFGHEKIILYQNRPFVDLHDMNTKMVEAYNRVVGPEHFVMWLGDAFFHMSRQWMREFLAGLNGRKGLIRGNHDGSRTKMLDVGFHWVAKQQRIRIGDQVVRLAHYPYGKGPRNPPWKAEEILLHGHTHDTKKVSGSQSINISVEAWNYRPVRIELVKDLIQQL